VGAQLITELTSSDIRGMAWISNAIINNKTKITNMILKQETKLLFPVENSNNGDTKTTSFCAH
jgi:hypothetical protein